MYISLHNISVFMPLPPDTVSECIMFWGCPSAAIILTDLVTTIFSERFKQFR